MGKHFTIAEMTRSQIAQAKGIQNTPDQDAVKRLEILIDRLLDPVRERWGSPIIVNSGYRSRALNSAVGGASGSQHLKGEAADITAGSSNANRRLFDLIVIMMRSQEIELDQLIDEKNYYWLHVSYATDRPNRNQILHL